MWVKFLLFLLGSDFTKKIVLLLIDLILKKLQAEAVKTDNKLDDVILSDLNKILNKEELVSELANTLNTLIKKK